MFLMPSRFEPCGLNQLYSLRYGTVPIVRRVGGLADTVVDASEKNLRTGKATGIVFEEARAGALIGTVDRALALHQNSRRWKQMMRTGMRQDFTWLHSATEYLRLYRQVMRDKRTPSRKRHASRKTGK
jgi:starch synthase